MNSATARYAFGPFVLIPSEQRLLRDGVPVRLPRKDFELLVALVEQHGHLLRKEELLRRLWPDAFVEEGNLNKHISLLRKALGEGEQATYVETVPRVGFRFIAPILVMPDAAAAEVGTEGPLVEPESGAVTLVPVPRPRRFGVYATAAVALGIVIALALYRGEIIAPPSTPSPGGTALAVLPFTGDDHNPHVGPGLADAITTRLSVQRLVPVRPTSAVRRYGTAGRPSAREIGRALGVDTLLEGHVQRDGPRIRVTVQLTRVVDESVAWADASDHRLDQLFDAEDVIAERVVGALRLQLAASEQQRLRRRYTANSAAYEAYLRGRAAMMRYTPESTRDAVAAFERALELDASYTLARAGLAMASADMYLRFAGERDVQQWGTRAEREARHAVDGDPDLAEAHLAEAAVYRKREFDWNATLAASRRALLLNPNLDQAHFFAAAAYYHLGFLDEAALEMERGRRVRGGDTIEPIRIQALVALFGGNFAAARQHLEDVSRLSSRPLGDTYLALAYYYSGDAARARAMLERLVEEPSAATAARAGAVLASVLAARGEREEARRHLARVLERDYRDHHVAYNIGTAYAQLGAAGDAVHWLRAAADTGFPCLPFFERDPLLDVVRRDEDFGALLTHVRSRREFPGGGAAH
jgi:DNA-binding winged helix-turn-helix (wHTH) protein/TolB-like protein/Tfp pilus assembly protein PilF